MKTLKRINQEEWAWANEWWSDEVDYLREMIPTYNLPVDPDKITIRMPSAEHILLLTQLHSVGAFKYSLRRNPRNRAANKPGSADYRAFYSSRFAAIPGIS